jgi:glycosyltransferase involved in cell wall biosynthesis
MDYRTDLLQVLFGGIGGHLPVASALSRVLRAQGVRSAAVLYAPPAQLRDTRELQGAYDTVFALPRTGRPDFTIARKIRAIIRDQRPRVVVCHTHYALGAVWRAQRAGECVATAFAEHQYIGGRRLAGNLRSLTGLLLMDAVVLLTEDYRRRYPLRAFPTRAMRHCRVIANGVELPLSPIQDADDSRTITVSMLGRMIDGRGFDEVLRACALLAKDLPGRELHIMFAGDGPQLPHLRSLAAELGLADAVQFRGPLPHAEIAGFLADSDIYVHASKGETMSLALLEAYAAGRAVVASDVEGIRTVIRHGEDGLLFEAGSVTQLSACLARLIVSPDERRRLGRAARMRAESEFAAETMARGYTRLFAELDPHGPWNANLREPETKMRRTACR